MDVSGHIHPSAALPRRRKLPVRLRQQAFWVRNPVLMLWNRENSLPLSGIEPGYSGLATCGLVTKLTELLQLIIDVISYRPT